MKFMTIASALFAATLAGAMPMINQARDVWNPKLLTPNNQTVWTSGHRYEVTWETKDAPVNITDKTGIILLRSGDVETPVVLAYDFKLLDGHVSVIAPNVYTRDDFSIVLFGDSGNWGDQFTINGVITF